MNGPILHPWNGHTAVQNLTKYGRNTNVDATPTDLWDLYTQPIWLAPTATRIHAIVSSDTNDTSAGTGARTVQIWGLRNWDSAEITETVTMNGTTPVNTANSYVIIHRMRCKTWSTAGPNAGIIKATAATDSTITSQMVAGAGSTQMAIYGVPSTQVLCLYRLYANLNRAGGATPLADVSLLCNSYADVVPTKFITTHTFGIEGAGTSALTINYAVPKYVAGPCCLKLQATGSTTDLDISGGFDGVVYSA